MANIIGTNAADIIIPGFNSADTDLPYGGYAIPSMG